MMKWIAYDNLTLKHLRKVLDVLELVDENGDVVGVFVPANLAAGRQQYAAAVADMDRDELERRKQTAGSERPLGEFRHIFESEEATRAHLARLRETTLTL